MIDWRWCKRCGEPWPDEPEFWDMISAGTIARHKLGDYVRRTPVYRCQACHSGRREAREALRADWLFGPHACAVAACMVILPTGRLLCHGHANRPRTPMTSARLAELTARFVG